MKVLMVLVTVLLFSLQYGISQNAFSIEMLKLRSKDDRLCTRPMNRVSKSKCVFGLSRQIDFSAAGSYFKNSLPAIGMDGGVSRNYHISTPFLTNFKLAPLFSLETGAYVGVAVSSLQALGKSELPLLTDRSLRMNFDGGFIAGLATALNESSKLSLRYNHGLAKVALFNGSQFIRRVDIGLTIRL